MGWWGRWKAARSASRALGFVEIGQREFARTILGEAAPEEAHACRLLALQLHRRGDDDDARWALERSLELDAAHRGALLLLAELDSDSGRFDEAIASYRRVLEATPTDAVCAHNLSVVLLEAGRAAEAVDVLRSLPGDRDPDIALALAKALIAAERPDEARPLLAALARVHELALKSFVSRVEFAYAKDKLAAVRELQDTVALELGGSEARVLEAVAAGRLDTRAGVNYKLLGQALMSETPPWEPDTTLRSVQDSIARGEDLVGAGEESRGRCLIGSALLREGKTSDALGEFERARELDGSNFAASLGIGAARRCDEERLFRKVAALPAPYPLDGLDRLVPELGALTDAERRVVIASVDPLRGTLPQLAARGATLRILPIDARLVDLPAFAPSSGERDEEFRCVDALTGAQVGVVAACKIESVIDVSAETGWTLAHELAHLVHDALPPAWQVRILDLHRRAVEVRYAGTEYQLKNEHEWLAVSFTDWLASRHGLPIETEMDEDGIMQAAFDFFDELADVDAFETWEPVTPASGAWRGEYSGRRGVAPGTMTLTLRFDDGKITGEGEDPVGLFTVDGWHDTRGAGLVLGKQYPSGHAVLYTGVVLPGAVEGVWELESGHRGEFRLWPDDGRKAE